MSEVDFYPCDLHTHTVRSDGNDTCKQLILNAAAKGIKILAITDHDITAPTVIEADGKSIALKDFGIAHGVHVIPGIEFSCDTEVEDVHIVALGCDWSDPFFAVEYNASVQSKIWGYRKLCNLLSQDGMVVDWEKDILLDGKRLENEVQRKQIFEQMAAKGYVSDWSQAKLLVKTSPRYQVKREKPNPITIIREIHRTGGVSILAHPFLINDSAEWRGLAETRDKYIQRLIENGLDGVEFRYPYDKTSYGGDLEPRDISKMVEIQYGSKVRILSGGSDYHNEGVKGSKNPRLLGEAGLSMEEFMSNPYLRALLSEEVIL